MEYSANRSVWKFSDFFPKFRVTPESPGSEIIVFFGSFFTYHPFLMYVGVQQMSFLLNNLVLRCKCKHQRKIRTD